MIRLSAFADEISQNPVEQVDVLSAHGIKHIEFRAIHGTNVLDLSDEQHAEFRDLLRSRGFGLSAIGSPIGKIRINEPFDEHLQRFDRAMALAEFYESPRIRIFSFYMPPGDDPAMHRAEVMNRMAELARRAAARGITLFLENEKGIYGDTAARVADVLETVGSPFLSHAFDPANYVEVGQPIEEAWSRLLPQVQHFHVKDYDAKTHLNVPAGAAPARSPVCSAKPWPPGMTVSASWNHTSSSPRSRSASRAQSGSLMRPMHSSRSWTTGRSLTLDESRRTI